MHVDPVAMLVRSVASGLPAALVTSANAPPPSGRSPAGSRTLHAAGWSKVSSPSEVVKLVQDSDAGAVPVGLDVAEGAPVDVGAAEVVGDADVGVPPGPPVVVGGAACGPQPASRKATRTTVGIAAPDAD
jgi:hypothetical protein